MGWRAVSPRRASRVVRALPTGGQQPAVVADAVDEGGHGAPDLVQVDRGRRLQASVESHTYKESADGPGRGQKICFPGSCPLAPQFFDSL